MRKYRVMDSKRRHLSWGYVWKDATGWYAEANKTGFVSGPYKTRAAASGSVRAPKRPSFHNPTSFSNPFNS